MKNNFKEGDKVYHVELRMEGSVIRTRELDFVVLWDNGGYLTYWWDGSYNLGDSIHVIKMHD